MNPLNLFQGLSIRQKTISILLVSTLLIVAFAAIGLTALEDWHQEESTKNQLSTIATLLNSQTRAALLLNAPEAAISELANLESIPSLLMARIYDSKGNLFAQFSSDNKLEKHPLLSLSQLDSLLQERSLNIENGHAICITPILSFEGQHIGTLEIIDDLTHTTNYNDRLILIAFLTLAATLLALLLSTTLPSLISKPVTELSQKMKDIINHHDYSQRAQKSSDDEVGKLVETFNTLLWEVETRENALIQHSTNLETQIQQRTVELQAAKNQAESANQAKSMFVANITHEIRTPLNGLLGMTELLVHANKNTEHKKLADAAHESSKHLLDIANDVLDFSKIEAGKLAIHSEPFLFRNTFRRLSSMFTNSALSKGLGLVFSIDKTIPTAISGDVLRYRQILINLIGNAIKFTNKGSVFVSASVIRNDGIKIVLLTKIQDSGPGLSKNQEQKIFQPFTQGDNSNTRGAGGTGLGLTISSQLVTLMGGKMGVSHPQKGGCIFWFTVTLEAVDSVTQRRLLAHKVLSQNKRAHKSQGDLPLFSAHVLLVEDNPIGREIGLKFLQKLGYQVTTANNGEQAIDANHEQYFDLILMDIQMPIIDGLEARQIIKKQLNSTGQMTPIVAITAQLLNHNKSELLDQGFDDTLGKL